jgi:hypothetical protein
VISSLSYPDEYLVVFLTSSISHCTSTPDPSLYNVSNTLN